MRPAACQRPCQLHRAHAACAAPCWRVWVVHSGPHCPALCARAADAVRPVGEDERRERWSFALASALGMSPGQQQQLLYSQVGGRPLCRAGHCLLTACCLSMPMCARVCEGAQVCAAPGPTPMCSLQSTAERLHAVEQVLLEWRGHLAACSSLHNL